jgi:alkylation response protein AidB-like acyl-CoA dehydrogenase
MDFSPIDIAPDVQKFWDDEVVPFYDEHLSQAILDREEEEGNGFIPALDRALAAKGWLNPTAPVEDGGAGLDPVRAAVIAAEQNRRVFSFPVKGSHGLVTPVVQAFGSEELKAAVLPGARRGDIHFCLGYTEPDCGTDAAAVKTRAVRDGDEWVITGQKMFSTGAHLAQYVMITARSNPDVAKHKGITMFLMPLDVANVETQLISTLGGERTNFIYFDEARVPDTHRLGPVDQGWQVASGALAAEHGLDAEHGALRREVVIDYSLVRNLSGPHGPSDRSISDAHDAAVEWARTSLRADGSLPIDDPLVRARLARVAFDREVGETAPSPYGRVIMSDNVIRDTADLLDLVGPAGLLRKGEAGAIADGLFESSHRFAQGTSIYGGSTDMQRNLIAEQFLGLPRHRGAFRRAPEPSS